MVDGSNESLYHANEEFDPNLCTGVPLQKSFEKVDVSMASYNFPEVLIIIPPLFHFGKTKGKYLSNLLQ